MDESRAIPPELFANFQQSLTEVVNDQHEKLRLLALGLEYPLDLEETLVRVSERIDSGAITSFEVADLKLDELLSRDINFRQTCQFEMSCIALVCAEKRIAAGDEGAAWPLLCHTSYLIGVTEDGLAVAAKAKEDLQRSAARKPGKQKGGRVTKEKYDKIRAHMIELLTNRAPNGGWITKVQAVDAIAGDLQKFALEADLNLRLPDIHNTATNWLKKSGDAAVNYAYSAAAAKI